MGFLADFMPPWMVMTIRNFDIALVIAGLQYMFLLFFPFVKKRLLWFILTFISLMIAFFFTLMTVIYFPYFFEFQFGLADSVRVSFLGGVELLTEGNMLFNLLASLIAGLLLGGLNGFLVGKLQGILFQDRKKGSSWTQHVIFSFVAVYVFNSVLLSLWSYMSHTNVIHEYKFILPVATGLLGLVYGLSTRKLMSIEPDVID
jgi:hypothetical protein